MNFLTFGPLLEVIQFITIWAGRLYMVMGEVITATALLWALKLASDVLEKTVKATQFMFKAGVYCGTFYYTYLHEYVLQALYSILINTVKVTAYTAGFITRVIRERREIMGVVNNYRNLIGSYFVYTSPQLVTSK